MAKLFVMVLATSADGAIYWLDGYQLFTACPDSAENLKQPKGGDMQVSLPGQPTPQTGTLQGDKAQALMAKAQELEAVFLSEMLSHAGLGDGRESFGGGIGEDQFSSFLRSEQAKAMAAKGGIGLAELLFRSMSVTEAGHE
jgi:peptidoglycan hydrolase FlgJ